MEANKLWEEQRQAQLIRSGIKENTKFTIDSLEVARMLEVEHYEVLRKLEGTTRADGSVKQVGIIPILTDEKILVSDYFIKDSYIDSSGKENKCYLFTRLGCDFIANKFNGKKGILFTAKYVKRFNEMEQKVQKPKILSPTEILKVQLQAMEEQEKKIKSVEDKVINLEDNMPLFNVECKELQARVKKVGVKILGGKSALAYKDNSIRQKVYTDIQHQLKREFGVTRYEAIKRSQLDIAIKIVEGYKVPLILQQEIDCINNQLSI